MLINIIGSPKLLNKIRNEIQPFAKASDSAGSHGLKIDIDGLIKSCPLSKATFFETMRLYTAGTTYKKVLQDVPLTESVGEAIAFGKTKPQSYVVPTGSYLAILHVALQTDPRLWEDPALFKPERFLVPDERSDKKVRADMLHLFAFGGGHNVCKGRLFTEREVLMFIAGFLMVWNFSPVEQKWEIPGKCYNGTGSASPNGKALVQVRRRHSLGG
jgi:cytochrome P450